MNTLRINEINQHGKTMRGKKELIKHLAGGKLTPKQAIQAKCFDCTGYFADGRQDCKMTKCPCYPFMIFNQDKSKAKVRAAHGQNMASFALEAAK